MQQSDIAVECPTCKETIRTISKYFTTPKDQYPLTCKHCKKKYIIFQCKGCPEFVIIDYQTWNEMDTHPLCLRSRFNPNCDNTLCTKCKKMNGISCGSCNAFQCSFCINADKSHQACQYIKCKICKDSYCSDCIPDVFRAEGQRINRYGCMFCEDF